MPKRITQERAAPSVRLTTLGNIRLTASCADPEHARGHHGSTVLFFDEAEDLVATCSTLALHQGTRTLSLRPDDRAWDVGPIDVARIIHLVQGC